MRLKFSTASKILLLLVMPTLFEAGIVVLVLVYLQNSVDTVAEVKERLKLISAATVLIRDFTLINIVVSLIITCLFLNSLRRRFALLGKELSDLLMETELVTHDALDDEIIAVERLVSRLSSLLRNRHNQELALVENITDVVCSVDLAGTITKINNSSLDVLGHPPKYFKGKRFLEFIDPEDKGAIFQQLRKMHRSSRRESFESRMVTKDGHLSTILWSGQWSTADRSFCFVGHDFTNRKAQEQLIKDSELKLRVILENMPVGIVMLDKNDSITFANASIESIFKLSSKNLLGASIVSLLGKHREADFSQTIRTFSSQSATTQSIEWEAVRSDGAALTLEVTAQHLTPEHSGSLVVAIVDITSQYEIRRMRQDLIAIVSHELSNPLTTIKGFFSLMLEGSYGEVPSKLLDRATRVDGSVQRLMRLVTNLLTVEKFELGAAPLHKSVFSFDNILKLSIESLQQPDDDRKIQIRTEISGAELFADSDRLTQVIVNFLSNAIKYSDSKREVLIGCAIRDGWFEVRVTDFGRGIPTSAQARIFEKFQQVDRFESNSKNGSGLGLAICKAIIEQHDGQIGVDSEVGQGSSFWFRLPPSARVNRQANILQHTDFVLENNTKVLELSSQK